MKFYEFIQSMNAVKQKMEKNFDICLEIASLKDLYEPIQTVFSIFEFIRRHPHNIFSLKPHELLTLKASPTLFSTFKTNLEVLNESFELDESYEREVKDLEWKIRLFIDDLETILENFHPIFENLAFFDNFQKVSKFRQEWTNLIETERKKIQKFTSNRKSCIESLLFDASSNWISINFENKPCYSHRHYNKFGPWTKRVLNEFFSSFYNEQSIQIVINSDKITVPKAFFEMHIQPIVSFKQEVATTSSKLYLYTGQWELVSNTSYSKDNAWRSSNRVFKNDQVKDDIINYLEKTVRSVVKDFHFCFIKDSLFISVKNADIFFKHRTLYLEDTKTKNETQLQIERILKEVVRVYKMPPHLEKSPLRFALYLEDEFLLTQLIQNNVYDEMELKWELGKQLITFGMRERNLELIKKLVGLGIYLCHLNEEGQYIYLKQAVNFSDDFEFAKQILLLFRITHAYTLFKAVYSAYLNSPLDLNSIGATTLSRETNIFNIRDKQGNTPLHWAAKNRDDKMMALLESLEADPTIVNDNGLTPQGEYDLKGKMIDQKIWKVLFETKKELKKIKFKARKENDQKAGGRLDKVHEGNKWVHEGKKWNKESKELNALVTKLQSLGRRSLGEKRALNAIEPGKSILFDKILDRKKQRVERYTGMLKIIIKSKL